MASSIWSHCILPFLKRPKESLLHWVWLASQEYCFKSHRMILHQAILASSTTILSMMMMALLWSLIFSSDPSQHPILMSSLSSKTLWPWNSLPLTPLLLSWAEFEVFLSAPRHQALQSHCSHGCFTHWPNCLPLYLPYFSHFSDVVSSVSQSNLLSQSFEALLWVEIDNPIQLKFTINLPIICTAH